MRLIKITLVSRVSNEPAHLRVKLRGQVGASPQTLSHVKADRLKA